MLRLDHLPDGWKGKPNACHQGAQAAQGEWLLFTDADTIHQPDSAAQAVGHAMQNQLDGLSLFLKQDVQGLDRPAGADRGLCRLVCRRPAAGHACSTASTSSCAATCTRPAAALPGVRGEALEDVALGNRLRQLGYSVPMLLGEEAAHPCACTTTPPSFGNGMNRLGADSLRWSGPRAVWTALFVTALMSPFVTLLGVLFGKPGPPLAARHLGRRLPAHDPLGQALWQRPLGRAIPIGALFVQAAAVRGILTRLFGRGMRWKGRRV